MGSGNEADSGGSTLSHTNVRKNFFLLSLIYLIIEIVPISAQSRGAGLCSVSLRRRQKKNQKAG